MSETNSLAYLLERYTRNTCTREELYTLLKLVEQDPQNDGLTEELRREWEKTAPSGPIDDWEIKLGALLQEAKEDAPALRQRPMRFARWVAAACFLVLAGIGAMWYFHKRSSSIVRTDGPVKAAPTPAVIAPGRNKALLTLANGMTIDLDSSGNGTLAQQGNVKIIKGEDGELLYYVDRQEVAASGYNTISTPRGGKYVIALADGTKVWLNAASSLKFPASFTGKNRSVYLEGEGYFEVAAHPSMPFHVVVNDMTVEVLGTHFSVNAYTEERSIATTLFSGAVRVRKANDSSHHTNEVLLQPGEQAQLQKGGRITVNEHPDLGGAIAWKDNLFEFNNTELPVMMRQIARWYDVGIEWKGRPSSRRMTGKFSRNVNLDQLIEMLDYANINMKIENKKIVIWEN